LTRITGRPLVCSSFTSAAPRTRPTTRANLLALLLQSAQVVAEQLYSDVRAHAGDQLVETVFDRLLEGARHAGDVLGDGLAHPLDEVHLRASRSPL
jgi:hypothetical protein